jgi:hypothetical protein
MCKQNVLKRVIEYKFIFLEALDVSNCKYLLWKIWCTVKYIVCFELPIFRTFNKKTNDVIQNGMQRKMLLKL